MPAAPSGRTTFIVVPGIDSRDWRKNDPALSAKTEIAIDVEPLDETPPVPGKALPRITNVEKKPLASPKPTPASPSPLPEQRTFHVWSQSESAYVAVNAKRASVGAHYAFYEDVTNEAAFTADEYATLHAALAQSLPVAQSTFGETSERRSARRPVRARGCERGAVQWPGRGGVPLVARCAAREQTGALVLGERLAPAHDHPRDDPPPAVCGGLSEEGTRRGAPRRRPIFTRARPRSCVT